MTMNNDQPTTKKSSVFNLDMDGNALVEMLDRRIEQSSGHWDSKYNLEKVTKENEELYLGEHVSKHDDDDEEQSLDNRIFSSIRTIVPYVTSRVTEPEVYPSSNSIAAKRFAEDIEKALHIHADNEKVREKAKFALEDAIIRRRGYLKPRYDAVRRNFCSVEYVPAESIIIDHKSKPYEEPRYFRHLLEKSVEDLLVIFPEMTDKIKLAFNIDENTPKAAYEASHTIHEDWLFVPDEKEGLDLVVCWSYKKQYLGAMRDPNWRYGQTNFLKHHTMPLIFFNVLSDGRTFIDRTSFVEQAKYSQKNIDERSNQIGRNAGLGSIGMPVVDSSALADDQSQYLTYEPDTVLELDVSSTNGKSINDVFTTWKAGNLSPDVFRDKGDSKEAVNEAFGTPQIMKGSQSDSKTASQDIMLRDQAFGRQQEIVDAIDAAMSRLYPLIAQFLLVYGEEEEAFEANGENGEFDLVMINTAELDTQVKIRIKSGTSMPVDKPQRRATADKAATQKMIDPLSYWEIMDEPNAETYAKRLMDYNADPASFLKDVDDSVFNRDAFVDIQKLKQGKQPEFRDELPKEYFDFLNHYVLSGDLENPKIDPMVRQNITTFIDAQLARGQKMLGNLETQLPTPQDVTAANAQTDQLNQSDAQSAALAAKAQPKPPPPGATPQPVVPIS